MIKKRLITAVAPALALCCAGALAEGRLENPQPNAWESGVAAITGWHCTSRNIEIRIDGVSAGSAGTGTSRADTAGVCGRSDTGFSLLFNYALIHGGTHTVTAYADGVLFGSATFQAGYLGSEFLTGLSSAHRIPDFPSKGQATRVVWQQAKQSFVATGVAAATSGSLVGNYVLQNLWMEVSDGTAASTLVPGFSASGSMQVRDNGTYSVNVTITVAGQSEPISSSGSYVDGGYYLLLDGDRALIVERGDTLTVSTLVAGPENGQWSSFIMSLGRTDGAATPSALAAQGGAMSGLIAGIARTISALSAYAR